MADFYTLQPYIVPEWANMLNHQPKYKVKLSNLSTPIHRWHLINIPEGFTVHIKRDDLTSTELSGNKVRNLELFFAEAVSQGCKHVLTGGGPQSGHCRAVSVTARVLGLVPHVVIEGVEKSSDLGSVGNTLLYRLAGSQIYLAPYENFEAFQARVTRMQKYISEKYKESCYKIPVGGSSVLGIYGFLSAFDELVSQGVLENFDDIVVTIATGGTATGLAVGNYLTGSKLRIHAVTIGLTKDCLLQHCNSYIQELGLTDVRAEDILDIVEGYIGEKYGTATEDVLDFITETSSSTGILLDPYYTGKGAMGMVRELSLRPERFKGKRILFIHTGGIFGLFNGEMNRVLNKEGSVTNNMTSWPDTDVSPI